jgi:excinuclease ABC subunit A
VGVSEDLVVPDKTKSIYDGAIACWRGEKMSWFKDQLIKNAEALGIPIFEPYAKLTEEQKRIIWTHRGDYEDPDAYCGVDQFFEWVESNRYKIQYKYMLSRYSGRTTCHACGGSRLRKEALYVKVAGKTIHELLSMTVEELLGWFASAPLSEREREHPLRLQAIPPLEVRCCLLLFLLPEVPFPPLQAHQC